MPDVTKYQKYTIVRIHRSKINEATYNPRTMSEDNKKGLKSVIKKHGLIEALVWNKQTTNLIGGHQRLNQIDNLEKSQDYYIDVCQIDVDLQTEIQLNIILNNTSLMGEYDKDKLKQIHEDYPKINFIKDTKFTKQDIEFLELDFVEFEGTDKTYDSKTDSFEKYKKSFDNFKKEEIEREKIEGNSISQPERNDKCLTIVFNNNLEKWDFMKAIDKNEKDKFIEYNDFTEIIKQDYRV